MKKLFTLILIFIIILTGNAQDTFEKDYDFLHDSDEAHSLIQSSDGGFVLSGASYLNDTTWFDISIIKTDNNGNQLWSKTYGKGVGAFNIDVGNEIIETDDNGFVVVGGSNFGKDETDFWVIKLDENGDSLWSKAFGGEKSEYAFAVDKTPDNGFIVGGSTNSFGAGFDDAYIIKIDKDGNEVWSKTYGTPKGDCIYSIKHLDEGGYIAVGSTANYEDLFLLKLNETGDTVWTKVFGGPATDEGFSVQQTKDGGYIIAGRTISFGAGSYDAWLIKTDSNGNKLWSKTYGGHKKDYAESVVQTDDGGYLVTGYTESFSHNDDDSDMFVIKTDSKGDTLWTKSFGDEKDDGGYSGIQAKNGYYAAVGYKYTQKESLNFYLVKMTSDGTVTTENIFKENTSLKIYPNPAKFYTEIELPKSENKEYSLKVYDTNGKIVKKTVITNGSNFVLKRKYLPRGTYFIELKNGSRVFSGKVLFE